MKTGDAKSIKNPGIQNSFGYIALTLLLFVTHIGCATVSQPKYCPLIETCEARLSEPMLIGMERELEEAKVLEDSSRIIEIIETGIRHAGENIDCTGCDGANLDSQRRLWRLIRHAIEAWYEHSDYFPRRSTQAIAGTTRIAMYEPGSSQREDRSSWAWIYLWGESELRRLGSVNPGRKGEEDLGYTDFPAALVRTDALLAAVIRSTDFPHNDSKIETNQTNGGFKRLSEAAVMKAIEMSKTHIDRAFELEAEIWTTRGGKEGFPNAVHIPRLNPDAKISLGERVGLVAGLLYDAAKKCPASSNAIQRFSQTVGRPFVSNYLDQLSKLPNSEGIPRDQIENRSCLPGDQGNSETEVNVPPCIEWPVRIGTTTKYEFPVLSEILTESRFDSFNLKALFALRDAEDIWIRLLSAKEGLTVEKNYQFSDAQVAKATRLLVDAFVFIRSPEKRLESIAALTHKLGIETHSNIVDTEGNLPYIMKHLSRLSISRRYADLALCLLNKAVFDQNSDGSSCAPPRTSFPTSPAPTGRPRTDILPPVMGEQVLLAYRQVILCIEHTVNMKKENFQGYLAADISEDQKSEFQAALDAAAKAWPISDDVRGELETFSSPELFSRTSFDPVVVTAILDLSYHPKGGLTVAPEALARLAYVGVMEFERELDAIRIQRWRDKSIRANGMLDRYSSARWPEGTDSSQDTSIHEWCPFLSELWQYKVIIDQSYRLAVVIGDKQDLENAFIDHLSLRERDMLKANLDDFRNEFRSLSSAEKNDLLPWTSLNELKRCPASPLESQDLETPVNSSSQ